MTAGVYEIAHKGRRYIGSAVNLRRRWSLHRIQLRAGNHHNRHLQHIFNKHGADALEFRLLVQCSPEMAVFYEQLLIDGLNPEFNHCRIAGSVRGIVHGEEFKAKVSAGQRAWRKKYEWKGKSLCLSDIAEAEGFPASTLISRVVGLRMTVADAIAKWPARQPALIEHEGRAMSGEQWAKELGMHPRRFHYWIASGMTVADCIARLNRTSKAIAVPEFCRLWGISHTTVRSRLKAGAGIGDALRPPRPMDNSWRASL